MDEIDYVPPEYENQFGETFNKSGYVRDADNPTYAQKHQLRLKLAFNEFCKNFMGGVEVFGAVDNFIQMYIYDNKKFADSFYLLNPLTLAWACTILFVTMDSSQTRVAVTQKRLNEILESDESVNKHINAFFEKPPKNYTAFIQNPVNKNNPLEPTKDKGEFNEYNLKVAITTYIYTIKNRKPLLEKSLYSL